MWNTVKKMVEHANIKVNKKTGDRRNARYRDCEKKYFERILFVIVCLIICMLIKMYLIVKETDYVF